MVYAHDSSIAGAARTLNPLNLIKLHSDYLSEGIKSTPDETKALGKNTKDKFAEIARHHGLIVVGYAGNDRSVMDALQFLLTEREYFRTRIGAGPVLRRCVQDASSVFAAQARG